ncbi:hypothetical protein HETIRDRAFT_422400 [Heterobasidion irregulare TC 32-1]|uniref:Uncharacterized protein n=1 Tax=Heterobasidion irregulare (strain TC 32-1) TaxID=747525 RepID=W4JS77_HETIT|nr:uncharacterized protein HETIRDRAFT_422400 [Heterobasidion irregulare TC 32-1]ETW75736.1 hypothetical protein HETIRDRAFT_422400 [Heterobasidion irregulare TC 32-1]
MKKGGIWETDEEFFERKTRIPTRIDKWVRNHYPKLWDHTFDSQSPQSVSAQYVDSAAGNNYAGDLSFKNTTFNLGSRLAIPNTPSSTSGPRYSHPTQVLATPGMSSTNGSAQPTYFSPGSTGHVAAQSPMFTSSAPRFPASTSTNVPPQELANSIMNAPQDAQYTPYTRDTSVPNAYVTSTLYAVPSTEAAGQARAPVSVLPSGDFTHGQRHAASITSDTRHGPQYTPSQHNTPAHQTNASTVPSAYGVVTGAYISNMETLYPTHASPSMPATSQNQGRSLLNGIVDDRLVEALGAEVDSTGSVWINLLERRQDYSYTSRARVVRGELHDVMFNYITRRRP